MEPEPWLRGPLPDIAPLLAPVLRCFEQVREDLARHTEGLTREQIWARPHGLAPLGFQLRHIAGSVERLMTYVQGRQLSEQQLAAIKTEMEPGPGREELLARIDAALRFAESIVRALPPRALQEPRTVGRKQLPTTVAGLLVHVAEHTQRHTGQAISAAKLARAATPEART